MKIGNFKKKFKGPDQETRSLHDQVLETSYSEQKPLSIVGETHLARFRRSPKDYWHALPASEKVGHVFLLGLFLAMFVGGCALTYSYLTGNESSPMLGILSMFAPFFVAFGLFGPATVRTIKSVGNRALFLRGGSSPFSSLSRGIEIPMDDMQSYEFLRFAGKFTFIVSGVSSLKCCGRRDFRYGIELPDEKSVETIRNYLRGCGYGSRVGVPHDADVFPGEGILGGGRAPFVRTALKNLLKLFAVALSLALLLCLAALIGIIMLGRMDVQCAASGSSVHTNSLVIAKRCGPAKNGNNRTVKADMSFTAILARAEAEDAESQYRLANMYYSGRGVTKDRAMAVKWWRKAAEGGNAKAQYNLACCYSCGCQVAKDQHEAFKWCQKAAEQGIADAQCTIGNLYLEGDVVKRDVSKAVMWIEKAGEQGVLWAQYFLGYSYYYGKTTEKNPTKAAIWLEKGANQGDIRSLYLLGMCHIKGSGVKWSALKATKLWLRAAKLWLES